MYRQYEDPWVLEERLKELEARYNEAQFDGEDDVDLYLEMYELRDRINYAWQDNEYECDCYDYADEIWMYENCYEEV